MKALVVGAGAVGQVFGRHLVQGGAEVTFLVRPRHVAECQRGFLLYPLDENGDKGVAVHLDGCPVVTAALGGMWDQVYLAVSSTALRTGTWLRELAHYTGAATIVKLQPGLDDRAVVAEHVAPARIVDGTIHFLSYHAPLPGETRFREPGMAYWKFPGKAQFSGDDPERVAAVVRALSAGHLPAKAVRDVAREQVFPSAILGAFVAALEAARWSFADMRSDGLAALGAHAAADALRVVAHEVGESPPLTIRLAARPLAFRTMLRVASRVVPVDLETYLRVHFTKVGEQMHAELARYLERADAAGLDVPALAELAARVGAA